VSGLSSALASLSGALALLGPVPPPSTVRARLGSRAGASAGRRRLLPIGPRVRSAALPGMGALTCGLICVLVAGRNGAVAGLVIMPVAASALRRHVARTPAVVDAAARASLPLTCDLVAAGLRAGASVPTALSSAADIASGHVRTELLRVAALLRLGTPAPDAWSGLADDAVLGPVAAAAARSADSGIRLADALTRSSAALRDDLLSAATARAERVGVLALVPLGLCFLPAFICLGVVPIIAGVATEVFSRVAS
jgi:Flp pilus assembly protein TadB